MPTEPGQAHGLWAGSASAAKPAHFPILPIGIAMILARIAAIRGWGATIRGRVAANQSRIAAIRGRAAAILIGFFSPRSEAVGFGTDQGRGSSAAWQGGGGRDWYPVRRPSPPAHAASLPRGKRAPSPAAPAAACPVRRHLGPQRRNEGKSAPHSTPFPPDFDFLLRKTY